MERGKRPREGENIRGIRHSILLCFYCVAIDPMYKLSNYIKMATVVMFGDEKGEKLWATVNTYFRVIFEEHR
jgi:hypothetical protein